MLCQQLVEGLSEAGFFLGLSLSFSVVLVLVEVENDLLRGELQDVVELLGWYITHIDVPRALLLRIQLQWELEVERLDKIILPLPKIILFEDGVLDLACAALALIHLLFVRILTDEAVNVHIDVEGQRAHLEQVNQDVLWRASLVKDHNVLDEVEIEV